MDRDKRNQVVLVFLVAFVLAVTVHMTLVAWLQANVHLARERVMLVERTINLESGRAEEAMKALPLAGGRAELRHTLEVRMPGGDTYSSLYARLELLARRNGLHELALDRPTASAEPTARVLDYAGMSARLSGTADYAQAGLFVADFENDFPFFRLTELVLDATRPGFITSIEGPPPLGVEMAFEGCARPGSVFR
jgi:hypothetical protein